MVYLGFRISRRTPTERYFYGVERAQDLAGLGGVPAHLNNHSYEKRRQKTTAQLWSIKSAAR